jgi:hypothetical protein
MFNATERDRKKGICLRFIQRRRYCLGKKKEKEKNKTLYYAVSSAFEQVNL